MKQNFFLLWLFLHCLHYMQATLLHSQHGRMDGMDGSVRALEAYPPDFHYLLGKPPHVCVALRNAAPSVHAQHSARNDIEREKPTRASGARSAVERYSPTYKVRDQVCLIGRSRPCLASLSPPTFWGVRAHHVCITCGAEGRNVEQTHLFTGAVAAPCQHAERQRHGAPKHDDDDAGRRKRALRAMVEGGREGGRKAKGVRAKSEVSPSTDATHA